MAGSAGARVEAHSPYSKAMTYSGALRYLRVDLGYEVVERDPDAAYLLFQFVPHGRSKSTHGSIEVIEVRQKTQVIVQLPELPEYQEAMLRDGLVKKLKGEYGEPSEPKDPKEKSDGSKDREGSSDGEGDRPNESGSEKSDDDEAGPDASRDGGDGGAPAPAADPRRRPRRVRR